MGSVAQQQLSCVEWLPVPLFVPAWHRSLGSEMACLYTTPSTPGSVGISCLVASTV